MLASLSPRYCFNSTLNWLLNSQEKVLFCISWLYLFILTFIGRDIMFISVFTNHGLARCYLIFIIVSAATIARYCLCSLSVFHMFTSVPTVSLLIVNIKLIIID